MAISDSILDSVKKMLGLSNTDTTFDVDVIIHINSAFGELAQIGVGDPTVGFSISDNSALWSSYITSQAYLAMVQQFVYLTVRLAFDPPATSFGLDALRQQILQLSWRINSSIETITPPSNPLLIV